MTSRCKIKSHSGARHPAAISPELIVLPFHVYLLASKKHGTLYLGVTNDLIRRPHQHRSKSAAGFSARYGVNRLVWFETYDDPATAIGREKEIKKWKRAWKIRLIEEQNLDWADLYPMITR